MVNIALPASAESQKKILSIAPVSRYLLVIEGIEVPITQILSFRPSSSTARPIPTTSLADEPSNPVISGYCFKISFVLLYATSASSLDSNGSATRVTPGYFFFACASAPATHCMWLSAVTLPTNAAYLPLLFMQAAKLSMITAPYAELSNASISALAFLIEAASCVTTTIPALRAFAITPSIDGTSLGTTPIIETFCAIRSSTIFDCFSGEASVAPVIDASSLLDLAQALIPVSIRSNQPTPINLTETT